MRNNGHYFGEEMGKEARSKKEVKEVEIYGTSWEEEIFQYHVQVCVD